MIEKKRCLRCGWTWLPRIEGVQAMCPKCKSRNWNKERTKK